MRPLLSWIRGILLGRVTTPVVDTTRTRRRQPFIQLPCEFCGKYVAHTGSGRAWKHTCVAGREAGIGNG